MDDHVKHQIWDLADTVIAVLLVCSIAYLIIVSAIH
jgi:hypothetical protein